MNVNMLEHQRSVLTALGIDVWVPKTDVRSRTYTKSLYRDIAVAEVESQLEFQITTPIIHAKKEESVHIPVKAKVEAIVEKREEPSQLSVESVQVIKTDFDLQPALAVEPFTLQAYCLHHCVLILDATNLTVDQAKLWSNIQAAQRGLYHELKWPFALKQFQDGRGAAAYVQGFMDTLAQEKQVLSIGVLAHAQEQQFIQLAGLQEMLDQPLLKRRLWQFMQPKVSQMEVK